MVEEIQEQEEIKLQPKAAIENVDPCKVKVTIEVSVDKIKLLVDRKFQRLNDSVQMPGFRRGHAPRNLLERKFGKDVLEELKTDIVANAFKEVAEDKKIEAVQEPHVVDAEKLELRVDAPFSYAVEIEVLPTVEVKPYSGLKVKKIALSATDKDINDAIEDLRDQNGAWEPVEGEAQKGDQIVADMVLSADGKQVATQENASLILAEQIRILGTPLPEFHKAFVGQKNGATIEYSVDLPKDFEDPELQGKKANIKATVKSLKRKKLPELNAEFLKKFDCDNVDELKDEVKKRLQKERDQEAKVRMQSDILTQILEANEFPLPESLIKQWAAEQMRATAMNLMQQGAPEDEIRKFLDEKKDTMTADAKRALKEHILIDQIAKKEKIFVTEEEVDKRIEEMASSMGRWPAEFRQMLEEQGMITTLRRRLKIDKVLDYLLSKATIE
jgi:trigger factor